MLQTPSSYVGATEAESTRRSEKRRLQTEINIIETDQKKQERYQESLSMEIRRMEMELSRLKTALDEKRLKKAKVDREAALLAAEAKRLKRRLNALS